MKTQVAIIGGGPGGNTLAIELKKFGIESVILEKEQFPRFHIGESMTGECGASVRALEVTDKMELNRHPIKWGTMVYGAKGINKYYIPVMQRDKNNKLLKQQTWQVRRSEFDEMLNDVAKTSGIKSINARVMDVIQEKNGYLRGLVYNENGKEKKLHADLFADCSGQNTFFASCGITGKKEKGRYCKQIAIFSHFKGCVRPVAGDEEEELMPDDTLIFYAKKNHWAWFIPIDNEIVSIGVVTPSAYFKSTGETREEFLLREMQTLNIKLGERVQNAEMVEKVHACSNYSYHIKQFTGKNWLCIGDSHRFIDPIFSLGLHFAMAEGRKAAEYFHDYLAGKLSDLDAPFASYQQECESGMDAIQTLLDAFWDYPLAFSLYTKDKRYRDDLIDLFAGRVYDKNPSAGLVALRNLNRGIIGSA